MSQPVSRRSFLRLLGMAAPVAAAAPKYFFAPVGGWHSDVIANPFDIAYQETNTALIFEPKFYYTAVTIAKDILWWSKDANLDEWPKMRPA